MNRQWEQQKKRNELTLSPRYLQRRPSSAHIRSLLKNLRRWNIGVSNGHRSNWRNGFNRRVIGGQRADKRRGGGGGVHVTCEHQEDKNSRRRFVQMREWKCIARLYMYALMCGSEMSTRLFLARATRNHIFLATWKERLQDLETLIRWGVHRNSTTLQPMLSIGPPSSQKRSYNNNTPKSHLEKQQD